MPDWTSPTIAHQINRQRSFIGATFFRNHADDIASIDTFVDSRRARGAHSMDKVSDFRARAEAHGTDDRHRSFTVLIRDSRSDRIIRTERSSMHSVRPNRTSISILSRKLSMNGCVHDFILGRVCGIELGYDASTLRN